MNVPLESLRNKVTTFFREVIEIAVKWSCWLYVVCLDGRDPDSLAQLWDISNLELCSWPFSLKLLWALVVDAVYFKRLGFGRRKSWLIPVQTLAGLIVYTSAQSVEDKFGLNHHQSTSTSTTAASATTMNVKGVTTFFLIVFFDKSKVLLLLKAPEDSI